MTLSRRDFLKLGGLALTGLAFRPVTGWMPPGGGLSAGQIGIGRVTIREIDIFAEPSAESQVIGRKYRDHLFPIYEEFIVNPNYANSPRWYRLERGFAASSYVQRVEGRRFNLPVSWVPPEGRLGEITVPFSRALRYTAHAGWQQLYRLYYQSVHWVTGIDEGPDGQPWYKLEDELLHVEYHLPVEHVRLIEPEELTPLSPEVPWEAKRIEVDLLNQTMTAYEGEKVALHTLVSTGIPGINPEGALPTATPKGRFNIEVKMPSKHMGDGNLTDDIFAYELPGVPWNCFFHETGVAFHGTFWHHNYGRKMSHGCVNMTPEEAKWLFRWTLPAAPAETWEQHGFGTPVSVI